MTPLVHLPLNAIRAADEAEKRDLVLVARGVDDCVDRVRQPVVDAVGVSHR